MARNSGLGRGKPQIPPLRCAPVGMTRGRAVLLRRVVAERELVFISLGGPKAHDSSGRDDKGEGWRFQRTETVFHHLWPTQADENQLPFSNCSTWKHRPPPCHPDRSAAQWRDLRFSGCPMEMFRGFFSPSRRACEVPFGISPSALQGGLHFQPLLLQHQRVPRFRNLNVSSPTDRYPGKRFGYEEPIPGPQ